MKRIELLSVVVAAASLVTAVEVVAQDKKPVELRYSSGAPPANNPWAMQIARFAKLVEEESKGELKIQLFLASALGSEQDTVQQVARGRIDMGGYSTGAAALIVPELTLLNFPGAFASVAERDCVLDNHVRALVSELFDKKGVKFLGWTEVGSIDLFGKKGFSTPGDMRGVKAAAYANKSSMLFFNSLGASPAQVFGTQVPAPQTLARPSPPHVPAAHPPHSSTPPHPSMAWPHSSPDAAQLAGVQGSIAPPHPVRTTVAATHNARRGFISS